MASNDASFPSSPFFSLLGLIAVLQVGGGLRAESPLVRALGVEESQALMQLAPGYRIHAAAAEPDLEEPVLTVWDGNGAMYVAEMRSYMQDTAGSGTKTARNGRVKRFVDEDGDGVYESMTVFVDQLNLPRMILPLDDRIAIVETDSTAVRAYRDRDDDGVADEVEVLWKGKPHPPGRSVEHQDSGLVWNLDNDIYVSYGYRHYRFTDGVWRKTPNNYIWSQWGLDHDETGQLFYSTNSEPFFSGQMPRRYWSLIDRRGYRLPREAEPVSFGKPYDLSFLQMKNLALIDDRGKAPMKRRGMTSAGGQSLYRGGNFPARDRGAFFITDPTSHVVRKARVEDRNGRRFLLSAYGEEEFLISPDPLFRPVNTATGPDGALYVTDMARGIIQDAPWLSEQDRAFIESSGLSEVKRRGRIWRVTHEDGPAVGERPRMLEERTVDLVRHLSHENGWWRMTAQKLILLRPDRAKAVPALVRLLREGASGLGRLHALWTLEGMGENEAYLAETLNDRDWRVRAAAVRQHEKGSSLEGLKPFLDDPHPEVGKQLILTLGWSSQRVHLDWIGEVIERHPTHLGVTLAGAVALWKTETETIRKIRSGELFEGIDDLSVRQSSQTAWQEALAQWDRGLEIGEEVPAAEVKKIRAGETLFFQNCVSCHGSDGKGVKLKGMSMALAPSLAKSTRVKGPVEGLMPVLLHGLTGPIEGQTYQTGFMAPVSALGITRDDRLAELVSYLRYAWGGRHPVTSQQQVREFREKYEGRTQPWTEGELDEALNRSDSGPEATVE